MSAQHRTRSAGTEPGTGTAARGAEPPRGAATELVARKGYDPPRLEPLGAWSALTLQQSVPIFPGSRF